MPRFTEEFLADRSFSQRALAFNEQLPIGGPSGTRLGIPGEAIPPAVRILPNGDALIQIYAPTAHEVQVRLPDSTLALEKHADGF